MPATPSMPKQRSRQRGAAALIVTLLLALAMLLLAAFTHRNLVLEQRSAAQQQRATQAFEAAEAGLEWALARLNHDEPIDARCETTGGGQAFRERHVVRDAVSGAFGPAATAPQPACLRSGGSWNCSCPTSGAAVLDAPAGNALAPGFDLRFLPGDRPGVLRLRATGCVAASGRCDGAASTDAVAQVEVAVALVAGLAQAPNTALRQPPGGMTDPELFFTASVGLDRATWTRQPMVRRVACSGDCTAALVSAVEQASGVPLLWVDGDARIAAPATLGTPQRPVLLVVDGALELAGAVQLHGAVQARSASWASSTGGALHGALMSFEPYGGNASTELIHDAAVLAILQHESGSFARVGGSWRDF